MVAAARILKEEFDSNNTDKEDVEDEDLSDSLDSNDDEEDVDLIDPEFSYFDDNDITVNQIIIYYLKTASYALLCFISHKFVCYFT